MRSWLEDRGQDALMTFQRWESSSYKPQKSCLCVRSEWGVVPPFEGGVDSCEEGHGHCVGYASIYGCCIRLSVDVRLQWTKKACRRWTTGAIRRDQATPYIISYPSSVQGDSEPSWGPMTYTPYSRHRARRMAAGEACSDPINDMVSPQLSAYSS